MANQEVVPADLYVQPPRKFTKKAKDEFKRFVQQFPPEHFIDVDVPIIMEYLSTLARLGEITTALTSLDFYTTVNDMGTESVHPLVQVQDRYRNQMFKMADFLRVSPSVRENYIKDVGRGSGFKPMSEKRALRLVYKYTNGKKAKGKELSSVSAN